MNTQPKTGMPALHAALATAQHTPGPWTVAAFDGRAVGAPHSHIVGTDGRPVAYASAGRMNEADLNGAGEASANARLIAAAPTLYDFVARISQSGDNEARQILEAINGHA